MKTVLVLTSPPTPSPKERGLLKPIPECLSLKFIFFSRAIM